jgi:hypothetical protein
MNVAAEAATHQIFFVTGLKQAACVETSNASLSTELMIAHAVRANEAIAWHWPLPEMDADAYFAFG